MDSYYDPYRGIVSRSSPGARRAVLRAAAFNAGAAALPWLLAAVFTSGYAAEDEYLCGDLGSLGAGITGLFTGLLVFLGVSIGMAGVLRRKRLLLVAPVGVAVAWFSAALPAVLLVPIGRCEETPLLSLLAAPLVAGGLTYLLGRRPA